MTPWGALAFGGVIGFAGGATVGFLVGCVIVTRFALPEIKAELARR